jgi:hypothetical protein
MSVKIKLYMKKESDYYVVYYQVPYSGIVHPIHSLKDKDHAEMYLDGVMSGLTLARKLLEVSEISTRVPSE